MPNYLRALRADQPAGQAGDPIRFIASTEGVKRDGMDISANAWDLDNFKRNPVVLWAHDYRGMRPPIGRAEARVEGNQLLADVVFDQGDPFAVDVERKYRGGFLNTVSVGWETKAFDPKGQRVLRADLLDISAVPVPGDPNALMERQLVALRAITQTLDQLDDAPEAGAASLTWEESAWLMLRVFDPATRMSERDRRTAFNRAEKLYRAHSKTAPEFLGDGGLRGLDAASVRGLFLEDEGELFSNWLADEVFDLRAGAVLNQRNRERLSQIKTLADEVLASAEKEQAADKPEDAERGVDNSDAFAFLLNQLSLEK